MTSNDELRKLAEAATPGEWKPDKIDANDNVYVHSRSHGVICNCDWFGDCETDGTPQNEANATFIAAANPARILALLDEVERLKAELEQLGFEMAETMEHNHD